MFFEHRPQQPDSFNPNFDLSWQAITSPARPAARTSDSVIPLQRQTYMSASRLNDDYEKHSQCATEGPFCQVHICHHYQVL
jgi:hypothetical protein